MVFFERFWQSQGGIMALRACAQCMVFNNQWPILILETSMSMPETEPISAVLIQGSSVESFYWCIFSEFSDLIFSQKTFQQMMGIVRYLILEQRVYSALWEKWPDPQYSGEDYTIALSVKQYIWTSLVYPRIIRGLWWPVCVRTKTELIERVNIRRKLNYSQRYIYLGIVEGSYG